MTTAPKAIQTRYQNYRFRSRLEARWAVFLDHCGFKWQYEPEGYDLSSVLDRNEFYYELDWDGLYLPDFYLPDLNMWLEIKPCLPQNHFEPTLEEIKMWCLCMQTGSRGFVFFGMPDDSTPCSMADTEDDKLRFERPLESMLVFAANCHRNIDVPGKSPCPITNAIAAAKSARFEFGESGAR
jgi:hypothetical protein